MNLKLCSYVDTGIKPKARRLQKGAERITPKVQRVYLAYVVVEDGSEVEIAIDIDDVDVIVTSGNNGISHHDL